MVGWLNSSKLTNVIMILVLLLGFSMGSFVKRFTSNEPAYQDKQKSLSISAMQPTDDPILMAKLVGIASLYGGIITEQPDRDYINAHSSYSGKWITLGPAFRNKYRLSEAQIAMVLLHEIGHWQTECAVQPSSFLGEQCADKFAAREIKRFYNIQTVEHVRCFIECADLNTTTLDGLNHTVRINLERSFA